MTRHLLLLALPLAAACLDDRPPAIPSRVVGSSCHTTPLVPSLDLGEGRSWADLAAELPDEVHLRGATFLVRDDETNQVVHSFRGEPTVTLDWIGGTEDTVARDLSRPPCNELDPHLSVDDDFTGATFALRGLDLVIDEPLAMRAYAPFGQLEGANVSLSSAPVPLTPSERTILTAWLDGVGLDIEGVEINDFGAGLDLDYFTGDRPSDVLPLVFWRVGGTDRDGELWSRRLFTSNDPEVR